MPTSVDAAGPRPGFKLPAPLNTTDESLERSVWSPSRRKTSIVANGSSSPRTNGASSLLGPQSAHGSGSSSPKAATPSKFEDPLLAMPSFRRSPTLDAAPPGASSPFALTPSPSFRAGLASSNSFSARRTSIGLDFRRSVPGANQGGLGTPGSAASPLPAESAANRNTREHNQLRGTSEYGGMESGGTSLYESSLAGFESGVLGPDDDDSTDVLDMDSAVRLAVARRHATLTPRDSTAIAAACGPGPGPCDAASGRCSPSPRGDSPTPTPAPTTVPRLAMRCSIAVTTGGAGGREEDEDFQARLLQNRSSWRARGHSVGSTAFAGPGVGVGIGSGAGEGLQTKTHAALQQLRGELKSLSLRSMNAAAAAAAGAAPVAAPPAGAAQPHGTGMTSPGGHEAGGALLPPHAATAHGRLSESAHVQLVPSSPSRLSHSRSSLGGAAGALTAAHSAGGGAGGGGAGTSGAAEERALLQQQQQHRQLPSPLRLVQAQAQ